MKDGLVHHAEVEQLLGAYALDAVDPDEAAGIAAHLEGCPRCRAELDGHREVAALLAHGGGDAPQGLWDRIATGLQESPPPLRLAPLEPAERPATGTAPRRRTAGRRGPGRRVGAAGAGLPRWAQITMPALAAAVAALVAVLGVQLGAGRRGPAPVAEAPAVALATMADVHRALAAPGHRSVALTGLSGGASASVVVLPDGVGYVYDTRLTPLPADRTYQLWGVVGTQQISLGLLGDDPAIEVFRAGTGVHALAITDEVASGVVHSSQPFVVVGTVSPPL